MAYLDRPKNNARMKAGLGVAGLHVVLGLAFINGLGFEVIAPKSDNLRVFNVRVPPPPEEVPVAETEETPEGEAAPPNLKAEPAPVVTPPPRVRLPVPPVLATTPSRGASDIAGPGSGSGGIGTGTGSGGQGTGTGSGGGRRAQRVTGAFTRGDYERIAGRERLQGTVYVSFVVAADGSVSGCRVSRSSGHPALDEATCRIIESRFRYRPAANAQGQPISSTLFTDFSWLPR